MRRAPTILVRAILVLAVSVLAGAFGALPLAASARPPKQKMHALRHVVLDPGHGGTNQGAPGVHGVFEKHLTLAIALELERLLRARTDASVTLTRREDRFVGLRERTRLANAVQGDVLLSIHCNASYNPEAHGIEVYFLSAEAASREIAKLVDLENYEEGEGAHGSAGAPAGERTPTLEQMLKDARMHRAHEQAELVAVTVLNQLHAATRSPRRGVHQAPFTVLEEAEMPAVVVEVGYSTHAKEGRLLASAAHRRRIALGLYRALVELDRAAAR